MPTLVPSPARAAALLVAAAGLASVVLPSQAAGPSSPSLPSPLVAAPSPAPQGLFTLQSSVVGLAATSCGSGAYAASYSHDAGEPVNYSFVFSFVPALDGTANAVSLTLVDAPYLYLTVLPGAGLGVLPKRSIAVPQNASFAVVPGLSNPASGTVSLQSLTDDPATFGFYVSAGTAISGDCAGLYAPPAGDLVLTSGANPVTATWTLDGPVGPPPPPPPQCGDLNKCRFTWYDAAGDGWLFDLCGLCREQGNEYTYTDEFNHTTTWNIGAVVGGNGQPGGNNNPAGKCIPPWKVYQSTGMALMFWTPAPECDGPDGTCTDPDTGLPVCCSGDCSVLATPGTGGTVPFTVADATNPLSGGVLLDFPGMPPNSADPFQCSTDPATGCSKERTLRMSIDCDPKGSSTTLDLISVTEPIQCDYVLQLKSLAACGQKVTIQPREL
jgi:hypothetical protein